MRNYFKSLKANAGFTLIELLVVIGILGVLAAALIATIDPFEQLKKASDSNVKNTSVEFVNASIRYYTTHNVLPWGDTTAGAPCYDGVTTVSAQNAGTDAQIADCVGNLIIDGELKQGFTTVTGVINNILISGGGTGVTACFLPTSKSQLRDPNTKYTNAGVATTGCVSQGGAGTTCYWCAQ